MPAVQEPIELMSGLAEWIRLVLELFGVLTIAIGAIAAVVDLARGRFSEGSVAFTRARYTLARYLALALEFQLAADVLETAIAPDWNKIGHLAAIGTIRTALNFFLGREMKEERAVMREPGRAEPAAG